MSKRMPLQAPNGLLVRVLNAAHLRVVVDCPVVQTAIATTTGKQSFVNWMPRDRCKSPTFIHCLEQVVLYLPQSCAK